MKPVKWPAVNIEVWPLSKIVPYKKNPRVHSEEQIKALAEDMKSDGVTMPILVDDQGTIIAGHGRFLAAKFNKFEKYPVAIAKNWTDAQKQSARIRDNQRTMQSGWDMQLLREEAAVLKIAGYDMPLLGFSEQMTGWLTAGDLVLDPNGEWGGMPHFDNPDAKAFRSLIVHFHDQAGVDAFAKLVKQELSDKAKFLWYPEMIIKPFVKYAGEGQKKQPAEKRK